jgi:hypothetical protein
MTRDEAIEIARAAAKAKPQSYYAEPFEPHEWVIDAIMSGSTPTAGAMVTIGFAGGMPIMMPEVVPEHLQPDFVRMGELLKRQAERIKELETLRLGDAELITCERAKLNDQRAENTRLMTLLGEAMNPPAPADMRADYLAAWLWLTDAGVPMLLDNRPTTLAERVKALVAQRDEARHDADAYAEFDEHVRDVVDAADEWHDRECSGEHATCLETVAEHDAECAISKAEENLFNAVRAIQPISLAPHPRIVRLIAERDRASTCLRNLSGVFEQWLDPKHGPPTAEGAMESVLTYWVALIAEAIGGKECADG